jgi:hypothetical protein
MTITNITEFFFLINNHGLSGLNPVFSRFTSCVNSFNGTCNCKAAEKNKKLNECIQLYGECASVLPSYKETLFNKFPNEAFIELRNNSSILNTIRR